MFRFKASSRLLAPVALAAGLEAAGQDVQFDVAGAVEARPDALSVRVDLHNRGSAAARSLSVSGELLGERVAARHEREVTPGGTASISLEFHPGDPEPGTHALALQLDCETAGGARSSQRAYLVLALGANPPPAVRLRVPTLRFETRGLLRVALASADGQPHRVRLEVLAPKGINAFPARPETQVPAAGEVEAEVVLLRGGVARGTRQGLVVFAITTGDPNVSTAAATGVAEVLPDPAWLPRYRTPVALAALALLSIAVVAELKRHWR